jgi:hypothetical protein
MNGKPVKVGFYIDFPKEDQKVIRKDLKGLKAGGLATPEELIEWSKRVIRETLSAARLHQREQ